MRIVHRSKIFFNGLSDFADVLTDTGMPAIRKLATGINETLASLILDFGVFIAPIPNLASITFILISNWGYSIYLALIIALTIESVLFLSSDYAIKALNREFTASLNYIFIGAWIATYAAMYTAIIMIEIIGHANPNYTSLIWPVFSIIVNAIAAADRYSKAKIKLSIQSSTDSQIDSMAPVKTGRLKSINDTMSKNRQLIIDTVNQSGIDGVKSQAELGRLTGIKSPNTIRKYVNELVDDGVLYVNGSIKIKEL